MFYGILLGFYGPTKQWSRCVPYRMGHTYCICCTQQWTDSLTLAILESNFLNATFHFSLHSSCLKSDCLNTKSCLLPCLAVYLSVHSVPPDQQQGQCGHQPQRACPHSFSGTLSLPCCLHVCMNCLSLFNYLSVHTFSGICPNHTALLNSTSFPLYWRWWSCFFPWSFRTTNVFSGCVTWAVYVHFWVALMHCLIAVHGLHFPLLLMIAVMATLGPLHVHRG